MRPGCIALALVGVAAASSNAQGIGPKCYTTLVVNPFPCPRDSRQAPPRPPLGQQEPSTAQGIASHQVVTGMTASDLMRALGPPDHVTLSSRGRVPSQVWRYDRTAGDALEVTFVAGVVRRYGIRVETQIP